MWNKFGLKHGVGCLKLADGSLYEGHFKDGFFSGLGTLILTDGSKYEGVYSTYTIFALIKYY